MTLLETGLELQQTQTHIVSSIAMSKGHNILVNTVTTE